MVHSVLHMHDDLHNGFMSLGKNISGLRRCFSGSFPLFRRVVAACSAGRFRFFSWSFPLFQRVVAAFSTGSLCFGRDGTLSFSFLYWFPCRSSAQVSLFCFRIVLIRFSMPPVVLICYSYNVYFFLKLLRCIVGLGCG